VAGASIAGRRGPKSRAADRKTRYFGDRCTAAEASVRLSPTRPLESGLGEDYGQLRRDEIDGYLGNPGFNSDQCSQFTSPGFTEALTGADVRISMDNRGRWMDDVLIERLWRSLTYECVYLHAFETRSELWAGLARRVGYYDARRPHLILAARTLDEGYGWVTSRYWPPDDNHNRAYSGRQTVRRGGTHSDGEFSGRICHNG
jgi:putative transposase